MAICALVPWTWNPMMQDSVNICFILTSKGWNSNEDAPIPIGSRLNRRFSSGVASSREYLLECDAVVNLRRHGSGDVWSICVDLTSSWAGLWLGTIVRDLREIYLRCLRYDAEDCASTRVSDETVKKNWITVVPVRYCKRFRWIVLRFCTVKVLQ